MTTLIGLISLALAGEEPPELSRSIGLWTGPVAVRQAARHVVTPALGAWVLSRSSGHLAIGAELSAWRRDIASDYYRHHKGALIGAFVLGVGLSQPWFAVDWTAGPAASLEFGRITANGDARDYRFVEPSGGLRLRNGFEVRFVGPVVARASIGALVRGVSRWDFDVTGGLGASW